ncbi:MAG TPA: hypothetical protein VJU15_13050 [Gemmatimonadales bacterium]|nr:hypothetical protein [Gemmatimonadales bacterium]
MAERTRRRWVAVLAGLGALYFVALLAVSLSSRTKLLPPGEPLEFCGAYLDCHLSAAVSGTELLPGPGGGLVYRVKVKFVNSARRATLSVQQPSVVLIADGAVRIDPLATPPLLELPPGSSLEVDFVFPTLKPLVHPRLHVSEGNKIARFTEKLLIGDTDSFLHKPVLLAVKPS